MHHSERCDPVTTAPLISPLLLIELPVPATTLTGRDGTI